MENNTTLSRSSNEDILLDNVEYFKYIFKKTEKIACAVFYILRQGGQDDFNKDITSDLKESARRLLKISLKSLRANHKTKSSLTLDLKLQVIDLESQLRIAHAGNVITADTLAVFINETDSVLRSLRKYTDTEAQSPFDAITTAGGTQSQVARARVRSLGAGNAPAQPRTAQTGPSRKERIIAVLKDKGEASIKDIVDVVTDCSEKTIQRDLIGLIKDNLVLREGERRWSKYRLV